MSSIKKTTRPTLNPPLRKSAAPATESAAAPVLTDKALELIAAKFRAMSEPLRLRLLNSLMAGELSVSQLVAASGSGQANVSKHLSILKSVGMVATRRDGLLTLYRIDDPAVYQLCAIMCARLKSEHEALGAALG
jgi:ArsR family transcriptional regulator